MKINKGEFLALFVQALGDLLLIFICLLFGFALGNSMPLRTEADGDWAFLLVVALVLLMLRVIGGLIDIATSPKEKETVQ